MVFDATIVELGIGILGNGGFGNRTLGIRMMRHSVQRRRRAVEECRLFLYDLMIEIIIDAEGLGKGLKLSLYFHSSSKGRLRDRAFVGPFPFDSNVIHNNIEFVICLLCIAPISSSAKRNTGEHGRSVGSMRRRGTWHASSGEMQVDVFKNSDEN